MKLTAQLKNFLRVLVRGAPSSSARSADPLAKTAGDLKVVNMSVEDNRLSSAENNARYVRSLDGKD